MASKVGIVVGVFALAIGITLLFEAFFATPEPAFIAAYNPSGPVAFGFFGLLMAFLGAVIAWRL